jgi:hypothetical protein
MNPDRRDIVLGVAALAALPRTAFAAEQRTVSIEAFGAVPGQDARPAILAAVQSLAETGGGTVIIPNNGVGGWRISGETRIETSNIRIELHDDLQLTTTEPSAALSFVGSPARPLIDVGVVCPGRKCRIDGNGRNMRGYRYVAGPSFPALHFAHCHRPFAGNLHAFNGLVNSLLFEFCGDPRHVDCDGSDAQYDNGISVNFYPLYRRHNPEGPLLWTNSYGLRPRAWNNKGIGIALYAAVGNVLEWPASWNNGNDIAALPTNGGGISIEHNTASRDPAAAGRDSHTVITGADVHDNYNIGIIATARGVKLVSPRIRRTRRPRIRPNRTTAYGSNLLVFGYGAVEVVDGLSEDAGQHGAVLLATNTHDYPDLAWDGTIVRSYGHGIWGRGISLVTTSDRSVVEDSGAGTPARVRDVRLDNTGSAYNPVGGRAVIGGRIGTAQPGTPTTIDLSADAGLWTR